MSEHTFTLTAHDWIAHPDGDFCPDCWKKFSAKYPLAIPEASPLSSYAKYRKASDGYIACCNWCTATVQADL